MVHRDREGEGVVLTSGEGGWRGGGVTAFFGLLNFAVENMFLAFVRLSGLRRGLDMRTGIVEKKVNSFSGSSPVLSGREMLL